MRKERRKQELTFWQIDGETMGTTTDTIFLGSKIIADGDCSHGIKRRLLLGRKVTTHLASVLKSRDTTLPTWVQTVKAMVFPIVVYGCESWTIKKGGCQRTDAPKSYGAGDSLSPLDSKEIKLVNLKEYQP